ncbi:MAG: hypothetical protein ABIT83_02280 [Massilia sp.]
MLASIVVHAVGLTLLYYYGSYVVEAQKMAAQVQASVAAASHTRTEKRVQDMEKIKSLLEKSSASQAAKAGAGKTAEEDEVEFAATSLPKQPRELLKEAQTLSHSIDEIARDIKAEEMAKVLKIPKEKALEQIPPPPATPTPPEVAADQAPADPASVAEEIKKLEAKARETLVQRQKELERQEQGVSVSGEMAQNGTAQPPGEAQGAKGNGGGAPDGAGSGAKNAGGDAAGAGKGAGGQAGNGQAGAGGTGAQGTGKRAGAGGEGGTSLSAQMATFINRDIASPANSSKGYWGNGLDIFNPGVGGIPRLETNFPTRGAARIFGSDGPLATRVYINSWYFIGPFDGKHGRDLFATPSYPPEQAVLLNAVYFGKDKRLLKWQYVHASSYPLIPPDQAEDSVYYGYTELMMEEAADLTMLIGADDDAQVWLNDRMVWAGGNVNKRWFFHEIYDTNNSYKRDYNLNEGSRRVHFKKGRNKVFFKLSNGPSRVFFSMVLTK